MDSNRKQPKTMSTKLNSKRNSCFEYNRLSLDWGEKETPKPDLSARTMLVGGIIFLFCGESCSISDLENSGELQRVNCELKLFTKPQMFLCWQESVPRDCKPDQISAVLLKLETICAVDKASRHGVTTKILRKTILTTDMLRTVLGHKKARGFMIFTFYFFILLASP